MYGYDIKNLIDIMQLNNKFLCYCISLYQFLTQNFMSAAAA